MRATQVRKDSNCLERRSISSCSVYPVCVQRCLSMASLRPVFSAAARRRGVCKSNIQVRNCAVAVKESHHTHHYSELGYRTDFAEHYSLLEVIGKGNFGTVWLAASRQEPPHQVAVKIIGKSRGDRSDADSLDCIRREVAIWGCLSGDSPYVAQLLGLYEDAGNVYLVQQLCQGGDLGEALKDGPLPEACCAAIMWCVLCAIRDCHEQRLALMDVKPQNFLLTGRWRSSGSCGHGEDDAGVLQLRLEDQMAPGPGGPSVVACDFGCSLSYTELMRGAKRTGSPVFFAPEQFTSNHGLVVDEWAAGVMLYLLLTGRYPFWDCKREDVKQTLPAYQVMLAVCSAPIAFSGEEWRGISRDARDFVSQLLDRNPATRLTSENALQHNWFARWKQSSMSSAAVVKGGDARKSQQQAKLADSTTAVHYSPASRRHGSPMANAAAPLGGCCGDSGDGTDVAVAFNGPNLSAGCGGSNIVPLLSSPYGPVSGGSPAVTFQGAAAAVSMTLGSSDARLLASEHHQGGSDDEDAPSCLAHFHQ